MEDNFKDSSDIFLSIFTIFICLLTLFVIYTDVELKKYIMVSVVLLSIALVIAVCSLVRHLYRLIKYAKDKSRENIL